MTTKSAALLTLALGAFTLAGCSTTKTKPDAPAASTSAKGQDDSKRESLERKLAIAKLRLEHTNMEEQKGAISSKESVDFAQEELEMAQTEQAQYEDLDSPNQRARSELDLKRARDRTAEAAEELKQLEIMYDEQDLQDMTAEFVINRGKRNAERAALSLAIQEREFESLTAHSMPRKLRTLQLGVARKASALERAKADAEAGRVTAEISLLKAQSEILDLEQQLEKLADGASS
ncbi:MAG: hypothetical protein ACI8QZ_000269 [Chlamydiales bacterium]|jgi:hypothetical protein